MAAPHRSDTSIRITVAEFLRADQAEFGPAWRYELVDGVPVAQAAPSPEHGAIVANLAAALKTALRGRRDCRPEAGSAVVPAGRSQDRARIPDLTVRCGDQPRIAVEVVSPSERRGERDAKRRDLMAVEGLQEIVEITPEEPAIHLYRRAGDLWAFSALNGAEAVLRLESLDLALPLADIYDGLLPEAGGAQKP